jgi:hypothetical protein
LLGYRRDQLETVLNGFHLIGCHSIPAFIFPVHRTDYERAIANHCGKQTARGDPRSRGVPVRNSIFMPARSGDRTDCAATTIAGLMRTRHTHPCTVKPQPAAIVGTAIKAWRSGARRYLVACLIAPLLKSNLRGDRERLLPKR